MYKGSSTVPNPVITIAPACGEYTRASADEQRLAEPPPAGLESDQVLEMYNDKTQEKLSNLPKKYSDVFEDKLGTFKAAKAKLTWCLLF